MNPQEVIAQLVEQANLSHTIFTVGLLMCRIMPVLLLSPFLGGEVAPVEVKMGTGLALSIVLFPAVSDRMGAIPIHALPFIALLLKEVFLGVTLSFLINLVFDAARVAGNLGDTMAGMNNAQLNIPQIAQQATILSDLKMQLSIVLFLSLDGHHVVIHSLADSLGVVPLDGFPRFSSGAWPYFELIIRAFADLMKISLALSAPVMVAAFITDMAMGLVNRMAPQVQVYFIAQSIKPLASVAILFFCVGTLMDRLRLEFVHMLEILRTALRLLG